jgi:hypothetical protein
VIPPHNPWSPAQVPTHPSLFGCSQIHPFFMEFYMMCKFLLPREYIEGRGKKNPVGEKYMIFLYALSRKKKKKKKKKGEKGWVVLKNMLRPVPAAISEISGRREMREKKKKKKNSLVVQGRIWQGYWEGKTN